MGFLSSSGGLDSTSDILLHEKHTNASKWEKRKRESIASYWPHLKLIYKQVSGFSNFFPSYKCSLNPRANGLASYHKIPIISPGLILILFKTLFCWACLRGSLFSEGPIIGRNSAFQNGLGLTTKTASTKNRQSMGLYSGGLIIGRIFASEIWGAYFREGGGGWLIGILRYHKFSLRAWDMSYQLKGCVEKSPKWCLVNY